MRPASGRYEGELSSSSGFNSSILFLRSRTVFSNSGSLANAVTARSHSFAAKAGEPEVRAWTIHKGSTAVKAAGVIHSDIEKGFIRAEVVRWDDLLAAGSLGAAREKAQVRLEGKDYVVQEGDVILFRHSG